MGHDRQDGPAAAGLSCLPSIGDGSKGGYLPSPRRNTRVDKDRDKSHSDTEATIPLVMGAAQGREEVDRVQPTTSDKPPRIDMAQPTMSN